MPHPYRFVLHDRDNIYSPWFDAAVTAMSVRGPRTPVQAPKANAYCERLLGSLRREFLDYLIPFGEAHLCRILRAWQLHYNRGGLTAVSHRPSGATAWAGGGPDYGPPPSGDARVVARSILGLHHEYGLERQAA